MPAEILRPEFLRRRLDELVDPALQATMRAWRSVSDADGCYDYSQTIGPIFDTPGILLPSSTIVLIEGDDPLAWIYAWYGAGFGIYGDRSFVGQGLGSMPDRSYVEAAVECLAEAACEGEIAYHRVTAAIDDRLIQYDRLILPMKDENKVTALVTTSVSPDYPFVRERGRH